MSKIAAEILDGRHDVDLNDIVQAVAKRLEADTVDRQIVVKVRDDEFQTTDLTYGALRLFETKANLRNVLYGLDLPDLGAQRLTLLIAAWFWDSNGHDWDAALEQADALKPKEVEVDIRIEATDAPFDDSQSEAS